MDPGALLDGLDVAQAEAVATAHAPLCIVAGAGSGKTRVLTRRVAHRIATDTADPRHVLVLTFTRRAAAELVSRLAAFGFRDRVAAGTFHAMAYAQLRQRWAEQRRPAPSLLERRGRLLAPLLGTAEARLPEVLTELDWAGARLVTPADYPDAARRAGRRPPLDPDRLASVFTAYDDQKRRRGLVDFDDLLGLLTAEIETDPLFRDQVRWRVRHLFVDEYQDVNPRQNRLLDAWRGGRDDLCVVGDPDQAIYGWNGADARFLTEFAERHPGARVVRLTTNYRSSPEVLAVARSVLATPLGPTQPPPPTLLRARRAPGPLPAVHACADEDDEAATVAEIVRAARQPGHTWSDVAVLARTRSQCEPVRRALERAGVPCTTTAPAAWTERPEVQAALRRLTDPVSPAPLATRLADLELQLAEGEEHDRFHTLDLLVHLGHEYLATDPQAAADGLAPWLTATTHAEALPVDHNAVEITTFHAAKGLEWPVVVLIGLEQGYVPIAHARTHTAITEERNLLYVAATRAERELHLTWAAARTFSGRSVRREPSPFLATIARLLASMSDRRRPSSAPTWRSGLAEARAELLSHGGGRAATPSWEPLLDQLRTWRRREALAAGVAPGAVVPDAVLSALAQRPPQTADELAGVDGFGPVRAARYGERILTLLRTTAPSP